MSTGITLLKALHQEIDRKNLNVNGQERNGWPGETTDDEISLANISGYETFAQDELKKGHTIKLNAQTFNSFEELQPHLQAMKRAFESQKHFRRPRVNLLHINEIDANTLNIPHLLDALEEGDISALKPLLQAKLLPDEHRALDEIAELHQRNIALKKGDSKSIGTSIEILAVLLKHTSKPSISSDFQKTIADFFKKQAERLGNGAIDSEEAVKHWAEIAYKVQARLPKDPSVRAYLENFLEKRTISQDFDIHLDGDFQNMPAFAFAKGRVVSVRPCSRNDLTGRNEVVVQTTLADESQVYVRYHGLGVLGAGIRSGTDISGNAFLGTWSVPAGAHAHVIISDSNEICSEVDENKAGASEQRTD